MRFPIPAIVKPAMMQNDGAAVAATTGGDIHIGQPNILVVDAEVQIADRVGVFNLFQINGDGSPVGWRSSWRR